MEEVWWACVNFSSFFNLGTRWGWVVNTTPQPLYSLEDLVPIVWAAGWALGAVWMGVENHFPTGPSSLQRVAIPTTLSRATKTK